MRASRLCADERGQAAAFMLSMLFVMTMLVAVTVNVGQAVNRRVALQILADSGAYTGATRLAVGYNVLARVNQRIQDLWVLVDVGTGYYWGNWTYEDFENSFTSIYEIAQFAFAAAFQTFNVAFFREPVTAARDATLYNVRHLFSRERSHWRDFVVGESDITLGIFPGVNRIPFPLQVVGLPERGPNEQYYVIFKCPPFLCVRPSNRSRFSAWFVKSTSRVQYFVWVVRAPSVRTLMFPQLFGNLPEMKAVAVARPIGGTLGERGRRGLQRSRRARDEYVVELVPTTRITPFQAGIIDDSFFGRRRPVTY